VRHGVSVEEPCVCVCVCVYVCHALFCISHAMALVRDHLVELFLLSRCSDGLVTHIFLAPVCLHAVLLLVTVDAMIATCYSIIIHADCPVVLLARCTLLSIHAAPACFLARIADDYPTAGVQRLRS